MKVLLVGQAPSRDTCGGPPFSGRSGRRLADLAGVEHSRLGEVFALVNLLDRWPGKNGRGDAFPMSEARAAAARLDLSKHDVVVLVGRNVARACGLKDAGYFKHHEVAAPLADGKGQYVDQVGEQWIGFPAPTIPAQVQGKMGKGLGAGCATFKAVTVFVIPHPSGVNRWWNDAANEQKARRFMEELRHAAAQG